MKYTVSVNRSFTTEVQVEAESPEAAFAEVNRCNFPLPPVTEWSGNKDWMFTIYDEAGNEVHEESR